MHCLCFKSRQTSGKLLHVLLINLRCIWAMWEEINAHRMTATKRVHNAITSVMIFKNQVSIIPTLGQGNVFTPVLSRDATKGRCHERGCHESGGSLWPSVMAICYSLLLWPSVVAFCYSLLMWPSVVSFWLKVVFCYGLLVWPSVLVFWYDLLLWPSG